MDPEWENVYRCSSFCFSQITVQSGNPTRGRSPSSKSQLTIIYIQKGYIGISYLFSHIFGNFLEVRYICPPIRVKFFILGTPSTQIWGKNHKKLSTQGAQGPPFFSIIPLLEFREAVQACTMCPISRHYCFCAFFGAASSILYLSPFILWFTVYIQGLCILATYPFVLWGQLEISYFILSRWFDFNNLDQYSC